MTHDPDLSIALKTLPPTLFRETVARLKGGQNVRRVARWLMTQDRGELQHLGFYDIRKQVAQLEAASTGTKTRCPGRKLDRPKPYQPMRRACRSSWRWQGPAVQQGGMC